METWNRLSTLACFERVVHVGANGCGGHVLDARRNDDVLDARHDSLRSKVNGLLGGAALSIDRGAWNGLWNVLGGEDHVATNVACLASSLRNAAVSGG